MPSEDPRTEHAESAESIVRRFQAALSTPEGPDEELMVALDRVFSELWAPVFGLCRRFVVDEEHARDLTQETLLRAIDKIDQFRGETKLLSWVYAIARSRCVSASRRTRDLLMEDGLVGVASPEASALQVLDRAERAALVTAASLSVLTPLEQEAVHLRYIEGLSQDQITALLGVEQASGARGLLQRCRRKMLRELRRRLQEMGRGSSWVRETL